MHKHFALPSSVYMCIVNKNQEIQLLQTYFALSFICLFTRILTIEGTGQNNIYCMLLSLYRHTTSLKVNKKSISYQCYTEYRFFAIEPDFVMVSVCACTKNITNISCNISIHIHLITHYPEQRGLID